MISIKKTKHIIEKWAKDINRHITAEAGQLVKDKWKVTSIELLTKEMYILKYRIFHSMNWGKNVKLPTVSKNTSECSSLSRVWLFATPWIVACQAPLPMRFPRQEYWNKLPCLPPGDLPNPGIEPRSPALQADPLPSEPWEKLM